MASTGSSPVTTAIVLLFIAALCGGGGYGLYYLIVDWIPNKISSSAQPFSPIQPEITVTNQLDLSYLPPSSLLSTDSTGKVVASGFNSSNLITSPNGIVSVKNIELTNLQSVDVLGTDAHGQIIISPLNITVPSVQQILEAFISPNSIPGLNAEGQIISFDYGPGTTANTVIVTGSDGTTSLASLEIAGNIAQIGAGNTANLQNTNITGNVQMWGNVSFLGNMLSILGTVSLSNGIIVGGNAMLSGDLAVSGSASVANGLTVTGNVTTLSNGLTVTGTSTLGGPSFFGGHSTFSGPSTFNSIAQLLGGMLTPFINASFLSTDGNGNVIASKVNLTSLGAITYNFVPDVIGNFNVSGTTMTAALNITSGFAFGTYDFATVGSNGLLIPGSGSTTAVAGQLAKYTPGRGLVAKVYQVNPPPTGSFDFATFDSSGNLITGEGVEFPDINTNGPLVKYSATVVSTAGGPVGGVVQSIMSLIDPAPNNYAVRVPAQDSGPSIANSNNIGISLWNEVEALGAIMGIDFMVGETVTNPGARIVSQNDGGGNSGNHLLFATTPNSGTTLPVTRMNITSSGAVIIGSNQLPTTQCGIGYVMSPTATAGVFNCTLIVGGNQLPASPCSPGQVVGSSSTSGQLTCGTDIGGVNYPVVAPGTASSLANYGLTMSPTGTPQWSSVVQKLLITTNGTAVTIPENWSVLSWSIWAGGGGGASASADTFTCYGGGGGAGGGYIANIFPVPISGTTFSYTIGSGGVGGGVTGTAPTAGGTTSITYNSAVFSAAGGAAATGTITSGSGTSGSNSAVPSGFLALSGATGNGGSGTSCAFNAGLCSNPTVGSSFGAFSGGAVEIGGSLASASITQTYGGSGGAGFDGNSQSWSTVLVGRFSTAGFVASTPGSGAGGGGGTCIMVVPVSTAGNTDLSAGANGGSGGIMIEYLQL